MDWECLDGTYEYFYGLLESFDAYENIDGDYDYSKDDLIHDVDAYIEEITNERGFECLTSLAFFEDNWNLKSSMLYLANFSNEFKELIKTVPESTLIGLINSYRIHLRRFVEEFQNKIDEMEPFSEEESEFDESESGDDEMLNIDAINVDETNNQYENESVEAINLINNLIEPLNNSQLDINVNTDKGDDIISGETVTVIDYLNEDNSNVVFYFDDKLILSNKNVIINAIEDKSGIKYGCKKKEGGFKPRKDNLFLNEPYFFLRIIGGYGVVSLGKMQEIARNANIRCVEISSQPINSLVSTASFYTTFIKQNLLDATGASHCQDGQEEKVYDLFNINFNLGGSHKRTHKRTIKGRTYKRRTRKGCTHKRRTRKGRTRKGRTHKRRTHKRRTYKRRTYKRRTYKGRT
jgi:hypothetical protein